MSHIARIAALSVLLALGISVSAASAGSFGVDLPHVSFPEGPSVQTTTSTSTLPSPTLGTRGN